MERLEFDIKHVADLCRIALTPEEEAMFSKQFEQILCYVEKLKEVPVEGIEPTAHAIDLVNVVRFDKEAETLPHQQALAMAPVARNGLFIVPKIVE